MTVDDILEEILRREGGYVDDPNDLGGATNFGITIATLAAYKGREVTKAEVKILTRDEAKEIYRKNYVAPFLNHSGDVRLLHLLVDSGVQHGVGRVTSWLSELSTPDPAVLYRAVLKRRIQFYGEIITSRPANSKFAKGWMKRVSEFI